MSQPAGQAPMAGNVVGKTASQRSVIAATENSVCTLFRAANLENPAESRAHRRCDPRKRGEFRHEKSRFRAIHSTTMGGHEKIAACPPRITKLGRKSWKSRWRFSPQRWVAFKSRPRRVILTAFMIAKALGVNIEVLIRKKQLTPNALAIIDAVSITRRG